MENSTIFEYKRKSYIETGKIYFWTATIHKWHKLLLNDCYKEVIIQSLEYLSKNGKTDVFAFVIMPNHIHLIWRINKRNGKESTQGAFLKFTAHTFKQLLKESNPRFLSCFKVNTSNKKYEFWQRDPLAIPLFTKKVAMQKLDYIHNNPLAEHWGLATDPCEYNYSSARYYEQDNKNFAFLKDLWREF